MPTGSDAGFFGKLSGAGDFVQRRLPADFVEPWDRHFQHAVAAARQALGARWDTTYRASPVWSFMLRAQVCGSRSWAGVMGPGVDRVGRSFPLVIARSGGASGALAQAIWHDEAARVLAEALAAPAMSVEAFDARVNALPVGACRDSPPMDWAGAGHWRLTLPAAGALFAAPLAQADRCVWWTTGRGEMPATLVVTQGLPAAEAYVGMLDAMHAGTAWRSLGAFPSTVRAPAALPVSATPPAARPPAEPVAAEVSAAGTAHGLVVRPGEGLVAVAADVEGGDAGQHAAHSVLQAIAGADREVLAAGLWQFGTWLLSLHAGLRAAAQDLVNPVSSNCAVCAGRLVEGGALLRIGSAAAWIHRQGEVIPAFAEAASQGPGSAHDAADPLADLLGSPARMTRAGLGAEAPPQVELSEARLARGDRVVLCCGAHACQLSSEAIGRALSGAAPAEARAWIARQAGFRGPPQAWPLAVVDVP